MSEQEKQKAASLEDWATTLACLYANAGADNYRTSGYGCLTVGCNSMALAHQAIQAIRAAVPEAPIPASPD